jgi:hypothetical protein
MSATVVAPGQLTLTGSEHLLTDLDERRERTVSQRRRVRAERRAEKLLRSQGARACRCLPAPWLDHGHCVRCGHDHDRPEETR